MGIQMFIPEANRRSIKQLLANKHATCKRIRASTYKMSGPETIIKTTSIT